MFSSKFVSTSMQFTSPVIWRDGAAAFSVGRSAHVRLISSSHV